LLDERSRLPTIIKNVIVFVLGVLIVVSLYHYLETEFDNPQPFFVIYDDTMARALNVNEKLILLFTGFHMNLWLKIGPEERPLNSDLLPKIYRRLSNLERINQKIVFNQLFNSNTGFLKREIEFLRRFSEINGKMSYRSSITTMVKDSKNLKVTDYFSCPET